MGFDWTSIAGVVAPAAPKLGAILGSAFGPAGSLIGGIAGRAIAGAFGVEATPEAVGEAIAKDRNAVEKLRILEATRGQEIAAEAQVAVERLKAQVAQGESIGATQRAEIAAGVSWWHWRHLLGYVTVLFGLLLVAVFGIFAKVAISGADISSMNLLIGQAVTIFGILAALNGYVASDTTNRINTAVTGERSSGLINKVVAAVAAKGK